MTPGGTQRVNRNEDKTFTIAPENKYQIANVWVDGQRQGPITSYTFKNVTSKHTLTANFQWAAPFSDVKQEDWFYRNVEFVHLKDLMEGTSNHTFGPNDIMTRGMFVTVLYRLAGAPNVVGEEVPFRDIPSNAYYADAVKWASTEGIVSGITADIFAPNQPVTRQEMTAIMKRYAAAMKYSLPVNLQAVTFADDALIASWAKEAVRAMQQAGVITGKNNNLFDPQGKATRAEAAAVLHHYVEKVISSQAEQD